MNKRIRYVGHAENYNPPQGVDISWHNDYSCTIHYDNSSQFNKVKSELKGSDLPDHKSKPKRKLRDKPKKL